MSDATPKPNPSSQQSAGDHEVVRRLDGALHRESDEQQKDARTEQQRISQYA
jgi:hypothetical protein